MWVALAAITLLAGALRLADLGGSPLNPFYDAAVRSMSHSWHNFFFGALEPGGSVSIDKPPVDLWLQVASVKALGYSTKDLLLPEALFGTAAVPLLFLAVRRIWSVPAGLAAALVLALLPIEVITSRSDTMDGVMMALTVLALLCVAQATQVGQQRLAAVGAAALGLAFDVKLTESLVALPGLVLFAALGAPGLAPAARRAAAGLRGGVRGRRAGVAAGDARLSGPRAAVRGRLQQRQRLERGARVQRRRSPRGQADPGPEHEHRRSARHPPTLGLRPPQPEPARTGDPDQASVGGRLLDRAGPLSGDKLGLLVLAALLLGLPALACELLERRRARTARRADPSPADERRRLWGLAGLVLWMVLGAALFSQMAHLHPRYSREHHARRGGDARDRPRLGLRASQPRAPGRARGLPDRRRRSTSSGCCSAPRRCGGW